MFDRLLQSFMNLQFTQYNENIWVIYCPLKHHKGGFSEQMVGSSGARNASLVQISKPAQYPKKLDSFVDAEYLCKGGMKVLKNNVRMMRMDFTR